VLLISEEAALLGQKLVEETSWKEPGFKFDQIVCMISFCTQSIFDDMREFLREKIYYQKTQSASLCKLRKQSLFSMPEKGNDHMSSIF
jgi:hypothetical protein